MINKGIEAKIKEVLEEKAKLNNRLLEINEYMNNLIIDLYKTTELSIYELANIFNYSSANIVRILKEAGIDEEIIKKKKEKELKKKKIEELEAKLEALKKEL